MGMGIDEPHAGDGTGRRGGPNGRQRTRRFWVTMNGMAAIPPIPRRLAGVLAATLLLSFPGTASAAEQAMTISAHGLTLAAPPPGLGIAVTALTVDGRHLELVLETDAAGVTRVVHPEAVVVAPSPAAPSVMQAPPGPCRDRAYSLQNYRWTGAWEWWFRASSTPAGMSRASALAHLKAAVRSITGARNDCDMPDRVCARAVFRGRTSVRPGIRERPGIPLDRRCKDADGKSVVGFGSLPLGVLGLTCTTYRVGQPGDAIEADVLLNKRHHAWSTSPGTCDRTRPAVIIRSIATHEFGHVFGLGHVAEDRHGGLTMSESIGACDDSAFTLGRGDVLGLQRLY
jgi:hypothetical protein